MPVFESTAIKRAEYHAEDRLLLLWFAGSTGPYAYRDGPEDVFDALCDAPSKGRSYRDHILDRYDYAPPP